MADPRTVGLVKVGLLARGEDRGLGIITWAFHRHLHPDRTLLVGMGTLAAGWAEHPERYPDALTVPFNGVELPEDTVRDWLAGLDVLYSAETFYDDRLVAWAREAGVATVLHTMPEFYRPHLQPPTVVWAPTSWRLDALPAGTPVVPVPVEGDVWPCTPAGTEDRLVVLHVAGKRAMADRNGTLQVAQAVRLARQPMTVRMATQEARLPTMRSAHQVQVEQVVGGVADRPELYAGAHVLVMPRRFGGLCLPVQEAMAAGLGVAMSNCPPNDTQWPVMLLPGRYRGTGATPAGTVRLFAADPAGIAAALDYLAVCPEAVADLQTAAADWARAHTWAALADVYRAHLEAAVASQG